MTEIGIIPFLAFGFLSTLRRLGSVEPLATNFGAESRSYTDIGVRFSVGQGLHSTDETSGNTPSVAIWDGAGQFLGTTGFDHGGVGDGGYMDLTIHSPSTVSPECMAVAAGGTDDVFIASISLTMPTYGYLAIFGDVAAQCGAPWYHSNKASRKNNFKPRCIWITSAISKTRPQQGFGIHIPEFISTTAMAAEYAAHPAALCRAQARFSMYTNISFEDSVPLFAPMLEHTGQGADIDPKAIPHAPKIQADAVNGLSNPITGKPVIILPGPHIATGLSLAATLPIQAPSSGRRRSRRSQTTNPLSNDQLVISSDPQHSARELCEIATSSGPDLIRLAEALFCDMDLKQLWPICSSVDSPVSCFDTKSGTLHTGTQS